MCLQATVYLLEQLDIILAKATEDEIKTEILPVIFSTLESNSIQGHEAAIGVFGVMRKYMDDQAIRKLVLPKAKALFNKSTNVRVSC
jgi:SCY1-like protein 2